MDSAVGVGAGIIIAISLQGFCLVTAGFWHEKGQRVFTSWKHAYIILTPLNPTFI